MCLNVCLFVILYYYLFCGKVDAEFQLPQCLHTCSKSDPNFNKCMIDNYENLLPEIINGNETYNIPNLNPLSIKKFSVKQGNKQIGLNMAVQDMLVYGIHTMNVTHLNLDMEAKTMKSRSMIRRLEIVGMHKTVGNIMVVKVYGEGKFNITADVIDIKNEEALNMSEKLIEEVTVSCEICIPFAVPTNSSIKVYKHCEDKKNVEFGYDATFDFEKRDDGLEYAKMKMQTVHVDNIENVIFNLENMLGDEKLEKAVNDMLNLYWRELSDDLFGEMNKELLEISKLILDTILGVFPVYAVITD